MSSCKESFSFRGHDFDGFVTVCLRGWLAGKGMEWWGIYPVFVCFVIAMF